MRKRRDAKERVHGLSGRIRRVRRTSGLTQSSLAQALGVAPSAVAQWEKDGGTQPSLQNVVAIAALASVSLDWLVLGRSDRSGIEQENNAIDPACIASDELEEHVLRGLRACTPSCRAVVSSLIDLLSDPAGRGVTDRTGAANRHLA